MTTRAPHGKAPSHLTPNASTFRIAPIAKAIALTLAASTLVAPAQAQQAFSPAWFATKGATQATATATGRLPNGQPVSALAGTQQQSQAARDQLAHSINNLGNAAQAIALQQALQQQARSAALVRASSVPDGLGAGGLQIDDDALTRGWINANGPVQSSKDGRVVVDIEQTADKAILNWETFNVGRNTTVNFGQNANWSVLNRVNDPLQRPSEIQGQINAPGTVFLLNRNGILFQGASQVNVRNLVAAASSMTDTQFGNGLFSDAQGAAFVPTFANDLTRTINSFGYAAAEGGVTVAEGARITTHVPTSVTEGGGYVMLLGGEVQNAGHITTSNGQTVLAAGDAFVIRKGMGTDANQNSTTRGNLVSTLRRPGSVAVDGTAVANPAGLARNTGLIEANTGDITMTGQDVRQDGVLKATTSVHTRGTVHLTGDRNDANSQVTLGAGSTTAIVLDESATTAMDVQRQSLVSDSDKAGDGVQHRRDQSLVQLQSGGDLTFEGGSLTLATSGQVLADVSGTSTVEKDARIDVSGHVGVRIAMEANNVEINVQGFEQRDAPVNRDGDNLRNNNIWLDRRDLVLVPAGTNGYASDRWYTAGGLLEVGGYLGITGHGIGEWSAQGGTVQFGGANLVTQAGSHINLSGGTLDVQTGRVNLTWLKGSDGQLYNASTAPGDLLYTGLYRGYEVSHARWGDAATETFYNPLIAPMDRLESGYVVGRDAGRLVVATRSAELAGDIETSTFQGERQVRGRDNLLDGYQQAQTTVARRGELVIGSLEAVYDADTGALRYSPSAAATEVVIGDGTADGVTGVALDAAWLNALDLGAFKAYARAGITVNDALSVGLGGDIALHATQVDINADLTARGGSIALGNMVERLESAAAGWLEADITNFLMPGYTEQVRVADGVTLDVRGNWNNLSLDGSSIAGVPYIDGGSVKLRSSGNVELLEGSAIDVSSGATLDADRGLTGGRGGSIDIGAGVNGGGGSIVLDADLRAQGVSGGGSLSIDNGTMVSIGGAAAQTFETLPAGTLSDLPLRLAEGYVVKPGEVIPLGFSITTDLMPPGFVVDRQVNTRITDAAPITLAAPWTVQSQVIVNGAWVNVGARLVAGTIVTYMSPLPVGYVIPVDVFPNGIPLYPTTTTYTAGSTAQQAVTIPVGTRIPPGTALANDVAVQSFLEIDPSLFRSGFARYAVEGRDGLKLADGVALDVNMPVLQMDHDAARGLATGGDPASALLTWLPPQQMENPAKGSLSLRGGADVSLTAGSAFGRGELVLGTGSSIRVDPGRTITLTGNDQITLLGNLEARGGRISVLSGSFGIGNEAGRPVSVANARSLWIGGQAVLDVSGQAFTGTAANGDGIGRVLAGGTIELGGRHDLNARNADAIDGFLVVKEGAVLDASGAQGTLLVPGEGNRTVASNGGTISLHAANGLFIDGDLRAHAGGAGAVGGTLALALETPVYYGVNRYNYKGEAVSDDVRVPRELVIEQTYGGSGLDTDAVVGELHDSLVYGKARYGVDAITAGGFDTTALHVNGLLSFDGDVSLRMDQALYLTASAMGLSTEAARDSQIRLQAPYLRLSGSSRRQADDTIMPNPVFGGRNISAGNGTLGAPLIAEAASLSLLGNHVDIVGEVGLGARGAIVRNVVDDLEVERDAFGTVLVESQGDLRLDGGRFFSPGDTTLAAAQIYGSGGVTVGLVSQLNQWGSLERVFDPDRVLDIRRTTDALPAMPYSVFGNLQLMAPTVNQGGVVRAPLGIITLGTINEGGTSQVNLLPGSVTSVSAKGLVMPYGGTVDGLVYNYNNADAAFVGVGSEPVVEFQSRAVDAQAGAVVDLSGGGELTGAALLQGRGGSTDARFHPLVQMDSDGFTLPGLSTNPVYAIVPGAQAGYAPLGGEAAGSTPGLGRQITIGEGVPGLPAGTYTLLPSTYALLPGAFRVEVNGLAASSTAFGNTTAMRNGSWTTSARLGTVNTDAIDALPSQVVLTAADTLRNYSQYNETSFAEFALQQAVREGAVRPLLERDAKAINLLLMQRTAQDSAESSQLRFDATVLDGPVEGGHGSVLRALNGQNYEILAAGAPRTEGFLGVSLEADALNAVGAARMEIGAKLTSTYINRQTGSLQGSNVINVGATATNTIVLREGATLRGTDVFLMSNSPSGSITLEQGAAINTLGQGASTYGSNLGYVYQPGSNSMLALSNARLDVLAPTPVDMNGRGAGAIQIGVCAAGATCSGDTLLYSEGTIATATDNRFVLGDAVRYGTRNLSLALGGINVGSAQSLADAAASGTLPSGLTLNQSLVDRLLLGDTSTGAPALESLSLIARESVNFFGDVSLSTYHPQSGASALQQLVLSTPAIYGIGTDDQVARIHTDTLVWTGSRLPAGDVIANGPGTGSGQLVVDARQIVLGYPDHSQPDTVRDHDRVALGFAGVQLNASERVTATHKGSLAVYQSQGAWDPVANAYVRNGGDLTINTPLLTGGAGSISHITAGGDIRVSGSGNVTLDNAALRDALGAELALDSRGGSVRVDGTVVLPSGKLSLSAQDDVVLADGAQLDLAGRRIDFFDVAKYSWGGDLVLESRAGNIQQAGNALVDLSAQLNRAGKLSATAAEGTVALAGRLRGTATGHYDAGGTEVPYLEGRIDLHGRSIADFAGLNDRLTESGFIGGRSFRIREGDLAIGNELKAHEINVSLDGGQLTVNGTIDASGEQVGSIRLAATGGVHLAGSAVLDASADVLRVDSYGKVIEAPNRATIEIDAGQGRLSLAEGARMDLRVAGSTANHGTVTLNAPRIGGNDVAIDAAAPLSIDGARTIQLNAFIRDAGAAVGNDSAAGGESYQVVNQDYLDRLHQQSSAFIDAALSNGALVDGRLAGLRAYGPQFRLRPGVEVVADLSVNPDGNLHVDGDIDLSGHRYASLNPGTVLDRQVHGPGEAGALVLRAHGDLEVFGSISDGFDGSVLKPSFDSVGWVLTRGKQSYGTDVVVPHGGMVTLEAGTTFIAGKVLNYAAPIGAMTMARGTLLPVDATLAQALSLPQGTVLGGAVHDAAGNLLFAAGSVLADAVTLPAQARLGAGFRLQADASIAAMTWPAGVALPAPPTGSTVVLARAITLDKGALIPGETTVVLAGGVDTVDLRPRDAEGNQGRIWAVAPMLAAGSQSFDLTLVAGADTAAADRLAMRHDAQGNLRFSDMHYGMGVSREPVPGTGIEAIYRWSADADAAMWELFGLPGVVPGEIMTAEMVQQLFDFGFISASPLELNDWGVGETVIFEREPTPPDYADIARPVASQAPSVVRTGTGDLRLVAAGDIATSSLYGIYTAGTPSAALLDTQGRDLYNLPRSVFNGSVLGEFGTPMEALVDGGANSLYQAWYPEAGGNVLLRAGGDISGDAVGIARSERRLDAFGYRNTPVSSSSAVGNWLWRQGSGSVAGANDTPVPTAWWINFGTYVPSHIDPIDQRFDESPRLVGFSGYGTLGGGNLVLEAGGNAGMVEGRGDPLGHYLVRSSGLNLAVASTGRVTEGGELVLTGGGDLDIRIGGGLNADPALNAFGGFPNTVSAALLPSRNTQHLDVNGTLTNLRGAVRLQAGAVGDLELQYGGTQDRMESRSYNVFSATYAIPSGGPTLVLGDAAVRMETRGDLVLANATDAGRVPQLHGGTPFSANGVDYSSSGWSWFSLWTPSTAIDLLSAGGNLTPAQVHRDTDGASDLHHMYPSVLRAAAANGNVYYGNYAKSPTSGENNDYHQAGVVLAPQPVADQFTTGTPTGGQLELLAGGSIYGQGTVFSASGADPTRLVDPFNPGFVGRGSRVWYGLEVIHNTAANAVASGPLLSGSGVSGDVAQRYPLFTFITPTASGYVFTGQAPARYYAVEGDLVGLRFGSIIKLGSTRAPLGTWYDGGGAVAVRAGQDIVNSGTALGKWDNLGNTYRGPLGGIGWISIANASDASQPRRPDAQPNGTATGNLIVHTSADDVSVIEAGRDIRFSSFYIAGPGMLDIRAGRDVYMADKAELRSLGPVVNVTPGDRSSGAGISVAAGLGEHGADWAAFAARYLDPANQADLTLPLADQTGKVVYVYDGELTLGQWLSREFGYSGDDAGAEAFLAQQQQTLDAARAEAVAAGRTAANRDLSREYRLEGQLHLVNWLQQRFGGTNGRGLHFDAATMDARAFFDALPPEQQSTYLRNVYYAELKASGREYNDVDGRRFGSYLRGREAIETLLPSKDAQGQAIDYQGGLTMFSSALYFTTSLDTPATWRPQAGVTYLSEAEWIAGGSNSGVPFYRLNDAGIHTDFGGDINLMVPGGQTLIGVDGGYPPGAGSGVLTQGEGDVNIYSLDNILMGQSRVFTTFGGNILAWAAEGDINAGRGAKTTVVATPQRRVYDSIGNVSLSPTTPNTGAGIATLNPIPEVPPGDIDLIAPLGTIDAGEAGIRVSGQVNLAALQVLNAENIQVQGEATGLPVIASINVGALTAASAAANSAVQAAQDVVKRQTQQARPSVISVEVLGFGDSHTSVSPRGKYNVSAVAPYDPANRVQYVGHGQHFNPEMLSRLSVDERRLLQQDR